MDNTSNEQSDEIPEFFLEKQKKDWKDSKAKTVEEYEFRSNPETLAPEKVPKQPEQSEPSQEPEKPKHDVNKLLDDLKKDSEKE